MTAVVIRGIFSRDWVGCRTSGWMRCRIVCVGGVVRRRDLVRARRSSELWLTWGRTHSKDIGSYGIKIAVLGFTCVRRDERVFLLDAYVAEGTPESVGADGIETGGP